METATKLFRVGEYNAGYPVRRGTVPVAVFVTESEAVDYAAYRNEMLEKHGTTDETTYRTNETPASHSAAMRK